MVDPIYQFPSMTAPGWAPPTASGKSVARMAWNPLRNWKALMDLYDKYRASADPDEYLLAKEIVRQTTLA
jgi:hypothetical protein